MVLNEPREAWGGPWTSQKLEAFESYVKAYLTIMKKQRWKTIYFDGFAGSGNRKSKIVNPLFEDLRILEDEENLYMGAAERLVNMTTPYVFDYYYFVDKDEKANAKLKERLVKLEKANDKDLIFRIDDCNKQLEQLASALLTKKYAALVFLDPFGMQIKWESIACLKNTRTDIWILIPTAVIVNRLLDKEGKLKNISKLETFFGLSESEIRNKFYPKKNYLDIYGNVVSTTQKVLDPINKIAEVYCTNLNNLWKFVSKPLQLKNRQGAPLFHFVFASNNANALKIAQYIIQKP